MKQTSAKVTVSNGNAVIESRIPVSLETIQKIESHPDLVEEFLKDKNVSHRLLIPPRSMFPNLENKDLIRISIMERNTEHETDINELAEVCAIHERFINWVSDMPDDKDEKNMDEEEPEPEMAMIAIPVYLVRM